MNEPTGGTGRRLTKNPLGPSGEHVRRNVTRVREARGWDKKELARRVTELGRPMPELGIGRIEAGTRRVDVDDLVALAIALGVNVSALLLPPADDAQEPCGVTGVGDVSQEAAWDWADGQRPLVHGDDPSAAHLQFLMLARPSGRRMTDMPPAPGTDPDRQERH
ncbi:helix-turn-helix transcriptional regulator [Streptomyces boncukensis]|uniref:helix-turn-helix domain-containing protein n=1 Tax=Streptomyces boncukensis TaxID=2711219 RepID=UPI0030BA1367